MEMLGAINMIHARDRLGSVSFMSSDVVSEFIPAIVSAHESCLTGTDVAGTGDWQDYLSLHTTKQ
jgi:hypothetical protein